MNTEPTRPGLFARARSAARDAFVAGLDQAERNEWPYDFRNTAHDGQLPPECDWRIWLMMAGRGFGKTRAGAEWVRDIAETNRDARQLYTLLSSRGFAKWPPAGRHRMG